MFRVDTEVKETFPRASFKGGLLAECESFTETLKVSCVGWKRLLQDPCLWTQFEIYIIIRNLRILGDKQMVPVYKGVPGRDREEDLSPEEQPKILSN